MKTSKLSRRVGFFKHHDIWANYKISLTWIKAIKGDDFPNPNYDFQGSLVVSSLWNLPRWYGCPHPHAMPKKMTKTPCASPNGPSAAATRDRGPCRIGSSGIFEDAPQMGFSEKSWGWNMPLDGEIFNTFIFNGKSLKNDENWGYPYFRTPLKQLSFQNVSRTYSLLIFLIHPSTQKESYDHGWFATILKAEG